MSNIPEIDKIKSLFIGGLVDSRQISIAHLIGYLGLKADENYQKAEKETDLKQISMYYEGRANAFDELKELFKEYYKKEIERVAESLKNT